ncbi:hydroxyacid dehydrogenase [Verminephrobacter aporrectodeae subsp. tuberculatae]|uniref:virulence RhuM family protein n=1 Tax=Verminephrobacter aporrectodeae TaxID=1110389 RepID=UPI002244691F|nr:virulence RhuM family protein [Verminephrobacter aporrectodeae]MCW8198236.1 hydroxyacid dehydrogenase [Verminephrobacter aporrectodeae subsp. tuberculatae]
MADDQFLPPAGEILLYPTEDGRTRVECRFVHATLWLSQTAMAELFQTTEQAIAKHLKAIFAEGELVADSVVKHWLMTAVDGKNHRVSHYNLEAILAVGYRMRSVRGIQFRRWVTERLSEYLLQGFTMDDERLKNPPVAGSVVPDYFAQLLERVRDIRASERRMYLRVREIFALAADYEPTLPETTAFFSTIQNKLHFAVTGMTAAELISARACATQPNMGLATWKGQWLAKADVTVAKNYLQEAEISELNRIVTMWLDFAEDQATRRKQVFLADWEAKLDSFLRFNDRQVLPGAGKIRKKTAKAKAHAEFEKFAAQRRALLEHEGEAIQLNALIEASKTLSQSKDVPSPRRSKK